MDRCTRRSRRVYYNSYTRGGSHRTSLYAPCIADNLVGTSYAQGVVPSSVVLVVAGKQCNRLSDYCWSSRGRLSTLNFRQMPPDNQQKSYFADARSRLLILP